MGAISSSCLRLMVPESRQLGLRDARHNSCMDGVGRDA